MLLLLVKLSNYRISFDSFWKIFLKNHGFHGAYQTHSNGIPGKSLALVQQIQLGDGFSHFSFSSTELEDLLLPPKVLAFIS